MFRRIIRPCSSPLTPAQQKLGRRHIIFYSMVSMLAFAAICPQVMSLLALKLDPKLSNSSLAVFFALMPLSTVFSALMGPVVDHRGKKAILLPAYAVGTLFLALLAGLPWLVGRVSGRGLVYGAMGLLAAYNIVRAMGAAGWWPLINDCIPADIRGRYFGILRTCWQVVFFAVSGAVAWYLGQEPSLGQFQVVLIVATAAHVLRSAFAAAVPEGPLEPASRARSGFFRQLVRPLRNRGFRNFILFGALLHFSMGFQGPFALRIMVDELGAGDNLVVLLTAFGSLGAVSSLYLSGRLVDRFGSRFVFAMMLPPMALLNLIWLFVPPSLGWWKVWVGLFFFGHGACFFGSTVAMTNMMLSSAGRRRPASYVNLCMMCTNVAAGLSPFAASALAGGWSSFAAPGLLSSGRLVFAVRLALGLLPLLMLAKLSRRHGGRLRESAGQFSAALTAFRLPLLRGRNS
jgi:MFS family permease